MTLRPIEAQEYREVLTRFATGVTVVTTLEETDDGPQPWGTTVNSFTGISLNPPLVMVSIGHERSIHPIIERTGRFGVNILAEGSQADHRLFRRRAIRAAARGVLQRRLLARARRPAGPRSGNRLPVVRR